jgi:predicted Zn-dependent peptidase
MENKIYNLKSNNDLSGFYVIFRGSTINESPKFRGISHLLEHLQCKNFAHLYDDFSRHNINWNAGTYSHKIEFYFTGIESRIQHFRDEYMKNLCDFRVTKDILEAEKKIVIEEYKDSFNSQKNAHYLNLSRKNFNDYDPIGELSAIENITLDEIYEFYKLQYEKPSLIINISKDFEYKNDNLIFADDSSKFLLPQKYLLNNKFTFEQPPIFNNKASIIYTSSVQTENIPYLKFIANMLGFGLTSPLMNEVREKNGLCYGLDFFFNQYNDCSGVMTLMSQTGTKNVEKFKSVVENILKNSDCLTKERFDIIKDYFTSKKETDDLYKFRNSKIVENPDILVESVLSTITLDKCIEVFESQLKYDNWYISVDTEEFKNL